PLSVHRDRRLGAHPAGSDGGLERGRAGFALAQTRPVAGEGAAARGSVARAVGLEDQSGRPATRAHRILPPDRFAIALWHLPGGRAPLRSEAGSAPIVLRHPERPVVALP